MEKELNQACTAGGSLNLIPQLSQILAADLEKDHKNFGVLSGIPFVWHVDGLGTHRWKSMKLLKMNPAGH